MRARSIFLWLLLWAIASMTLSLSSYQSSSNDSKFYNTQVQRLNEKPMSQWIAPKWGENYWGNPPERYIRDHFVGNLIPGALLARLGVPPQHALTITQMLFQIMSLFLLVKISSFFVSEKKAIHLLWLLQLMPVAFSYGIRANHEQGMMFWLLLAVYGALSLIYHSKGILLVMLGSAGVFLAKGAPAILLPFFVFVVWMVCGREVQRSQRKWLGVAASLVAIVLSAIVYEALYRKATGLPFLEEYWRVQIDGRSLQATGALVWPLQKLANLWYYLNRSLTYTMPWGLICLFAFFKIWKQEKAATFRRLLKSRHLMVIFLIGMVYVFAFSLSDRTASRYIFPVYYLFASYFGVWLLGHSGFLKKLSEKIAKSLGVMPFASLLWFFSFNLHLAAFYLKAD